MNQLFAKNRLVMGMVVRLFYQRNATQRADILPPLLLG